ncbi:hypothetical protein DH2020_003017 [Rehmannia glutinosa]|uniref:Uncharacterized protein n=1 Tax=Rehmannia glutinosa TaxID=99300 RepID=A0ABR0XKF0_REHGL
MSISRLCTPYRMSRILSSDNNVFGYQRVTFEFRYRYLSNYTRLQNYSTRRRNFSVHNSVQPNAPLPSQPPSSSLNSANNYFTLRGQQMGPLLNIKQEVDTTVETIEEIVDIVEKMAEVVDKVAENISGLAGRRKIEESGGCCGGFMDPKNSLQEVEKKVENIVETLSDKANEHPKEAKG